MSVTIGKYGNLHGVHSVKRNSSGGVRAGKTENIKGFDFNVRIEGEKKFAHLKVETLEELEELMIDCTDEIELNNVLAENVELARELRKREKAEIEKREARVFEDSVSRFFNADAEDITLLKARMLRKNG